MMDSPINYVYLVYILNSASLFCSNIEDIGNVKLNMNHSQSPHTVNTGLVHSEEIVGQKLLDLEGQKSQLMRELEKVEQEVQQSLAKSHTLDSEIQYPSVTCFLSA